MAFVPRDFDRILQEMLDWFAANPDVEDGILPSDITVGSLQVSHLEVVAAAIEEYEVRTGASIEGAILESCYKAFGFERQPARKAQGAVVFTSLMPTPQEISIPAGLRIVATGGMVFETMVPASISAGASFSPLTAVQALDPGTKGNLPARSLVRMSSAPAGVDICTNPSPTLGGTEMESDEARASRFMSWVQTFARGTADSLEFAVVSSGLVAAARCVEPFLLPNPPVGTPYSGLVWLFVDTGSGVLDATTRAALAKIVNGYLDPSTGVQVPGWKASGVRVEILPAAYVQVAVRGEVRLAPAGLSRWTSISIALTSAVTGYFHSLRVGDSVSYQRLSALLQEVDGDIEEVVLHLWKDGADVPPPYGVVPLAGDVSPISDLNPYSVGSRCAFLQGPSGGTSYPEWRLLP